MHPPEKRADAVFRRLVKALVPQQKLPVQRPALHPERRVENLAVRAVTGGHIPLQVMARDQLVMRHGMREMRVVAAHAHHFLLVRHGRGRVGNEDRLAAEKERADELALGRHHLHPPRIAGQRRDGNEFVLLDILDRLARLVADQLGLFAGLDIFLLDRSRALFSSRRQSPYRAKPFSSRPRTTQIPCWRSRPVAPGVYGIIS